MSLTISLVPGKTWVAGELVTADKLNATGNPTINLAGSIGSVGIGAGAVTTDKLAAGVLSADAVGRSKMADGYITLVKILDAIFTADAAGRAKFANGFVTAALTEETNRQQIGIYAAGIQAAGTYAIALATAATAYTAGMVVRFKADTDNTGAVSLNVSGLGAKVLKWATSGGLAPINAGEITAGMIVTAVYDGTAFQAQNSSTPRYVVADTVVAAGLVISAAHGLGATPSTVQFVLKCVVDDTATTGHAVGDEVSVTGASVGSASTIQNFQPAANATNVWLTAQETNFRVMHKTTGNMTPTLNAHWVAKGYARL